jgi:hypothetical protein
MATGFDELVEQLLYGVALSGSQGMTFDSSSRQLGSGCSNPDIRSEQK